MKNDIRRHWHVAAAALLLWSFGGFFASDARTDEASPAAAGDAQATVSVEAGDAASLRPDEMQTLRQRIEATETQIQLLKSVVIQALRGQSAAEETLQREREARDIAPGAGPGAAASRDLVLADQLEALTESVGLLREEVAALRAESLSARQSARSGGPESSASDLIDEAEAVAAADPIADSGVGGAYDPLIEDEAAAFPAIDSRGDQIEVGLVHFDSGSASLTPGAERKALEAADRIKAMEAARVRVIGYTDTMGDAGYNRQLSAERARSIAHVLEFAGLPGGAVEVVGSGEDGIPVPTADQVSEPLNRCAGIFVVMDTPK